MSGWPQEGSEKVLPDGWRSAALHVEVAARSVLMRDEAPSRVVVSSRIGARIDACLGQLDGA
jgi:hypothetical protein